MPANDARIDDACAVALDLRAELAEGLHWDARRSRLWGVDIHGAKLWQWDLHSSQYQSWQLDQRIGWVLPVAQGNDLLLGLQTGFALADADSPERHAWLARPFGANTAMRLNDAKADASGAVWAGSLNNDDETRSDGCLFRLDPDGSLTVIDRHYCVPNGPAISADSRLMLHIDSARTTIYAFDFDLATHSVGGKRVWKTFQSEDGAPDGMCFDAEGCLWVAHWGRGWVSRFSPQGDLLRRVALPVTQVASVCFAGAALERLFVTSARVGLKADEMARQPLAGSLFEISQPGTTGLPCLPCGPFTMTS